MFIKKDMTYKILSSSPEICKFNPCKHPNCTECGNRSYVSIAGEMNHVGIDTLWLILWAEIQNFYGDISKEETQEQFLRRCQRNLVLSKSPEIPDMTIDQAIAILDKHNQWRRGGDDPMIHPHEIGRAIDIVVNHFKHL